MRVLLTILLVLQAVSVHAQENQNLQEADRYLESLKSRDVFRAGEKVGEIEKVLVDVGSRQLVAVVLKYDAGPLNFRDFRVIVRFDQIEISPTYPHGASIVLSNDELKALPQWQRDR